MMAMPQLVTKKRWYEKTIRDGVFDDLHKSPMPAQDGPLPDHRPRMPNPFPPVSWVADIRGYARSDKSAKTFGPAEEAEVKANRAKFEKALAGADVNERTANLAKNLSAQLDSKYNGKTAKLEKGDKRHPAEKRVLRACLSLEALLAAGNDFAAADDRKVLLRAMDALSPTQQKDLLRADESTGRRLYSALYLASQDDTQLKDRFAQVRGAAQLARAESSFDKHDPSGETSAVLNSVLAHVGRAGLSDQEQNAFVEKLNFKLTVQPAQLPDLPLPDTSKDGWREKFTCRTLSILAETPAVSDESIEKALNMPEADLVKVLGHAYIGPRDDSPNFNPDMMRREGDMRLARAGRGVAAKTNNADLHALLEGLESNYLNRRRMLEEAQKGTPVKDILKILEREAAEEAGKLAADGQKKLEEAVQNLRIAEKAVDEEIAEVKEQVRKGRKAKPRNVAEMEELGAQYGKLVKLKAELEQIKATLKDAEAPTAEQSVLLMKRFGRFALEPCLKIRAQFRIRSRNQEVRQSRGCWGVAD